MLFRDPLDKDLTDAMAYALDGGKALRGFLVLESAGLHDLDADAAIDAAMAIECIHAYSLIHDDLPCMDDDDLRRGKPTVHKAWNEHTAVLAGDALQALAFELMAASPVPAERALALSLGLAKAAGHKGMVGGQMLDIQAETSTAPLTLEQIIAVQNGKTGALIKWSATAGAQLAGADPTALEVYGDKLGLAFQIADDILDVESDAATLGKATQKDADAGKATFVSLLGLDGAKRRAADLVTDARDSLSTYGETANVLRQAAEFVITRQS
ncbi:MAG: polyprenyl synthetase family protein [Pseudomonadota bacterium]